MEENEVDAREDGSAGSVEKEIKEEVVEVSVSNEGGQDPLRETGKSVLSEGNAAGESENVVSTEEEAGGENGAVVPEEDTKEEIEIQLSPEDIKPAVECILYMSENPIPDKKIARILKIKTEEVREAIAGLIDERNSASSGLEVGEVAGGYILRTKPKFGQWLKKFSRILKRPRLSVAALETLAIIAYKQPITRAEIEGIRGVNVDAIMKTLLEKNLINAVGRKEVIGRPLLYGTTDEFLRYFGLKDLTVLPSPSEIKKLT